MTNDEESNLRLRLQEKFDLRYVQIKDALIDRLLVRGFAGLVLTSFIVAFIALVLK
jgi:hypothetical protein